MNPEPWNRSNMQAIVLSAGIAILTAMSVSAQEQTDITRNKPSVKNVPATQPEESKKTSDLVSIELRMIEMPRLVADEVFKEQGGIAKTYLINEKTLGVISAMVIGKQARVVGQSQVVTKSCMNSEIKSVQEVVYPAEFESHVSAERDGQTTNTVETKGLETPASTQIGGGIERREIGTILSVSPVVDDSGKMIDLTIMPQRVRKSTRTYKPEENWSKGKTEYNHPTFITETLATCIAAPTGKPILLGVCDAIEDQEKSEKAGENIILWIITATIVPLAL